MSKRRFSDFLTAIEYLESVKHPTDEDFRVALKTIDRILVVAQSLAERLDEVEYAWLLSTRQVIADEDVHRIIEAYQSGLSLNAVAAEFKISPATVWQFLIAHGIPRRPAPSKRVRTIPKPK